MSIKEFICWMSIASLAVFVFFLGLNSFNMSLYVSLITLKIIMFLWIIFSILAIVVKLTEFLNRR